ADRCARHGPHRRGVSGGDADQRADAVVHSQAAGDDRCSRDRRSVDAEGTGQLHARAVREYPEPHQLNPHGAPARMITLTTGQLEAWLAQLLWPFVRVSSCFMVAPAFGAIFVPARIRIVLAGAITVVIAPLVSAPAAITPFSATGLIVTIQQ